MTYFDIKQLILGQLHGGHISAEEAQGALRGLGLQWPLQLACVCLGSESWLGDEIVQIDCHAGLAYVLSNKRLQLANFYDHDAIISDWFTAHSAAEFLDALRSAVLQQRERLFISIGFSETAISVSDYRQQRDHLINAITSGREWKSACSAWIQSCMLCYYRHLMELRRKIIETASMISVDLEESWLFDQHPSYYQKRLHATYDYRAIIELTEAYFEAIALACHRMRGQEIGHIDPASIDDDLVRSACMYATEHYQEPIGLREVAAACFVSAEHLARCCKRVLGDSMVHYIQHLRINHARELLTHSNQGVLQIAYDSGFQSPKHFHRVFKQQTEMTPAAYRRTYRSS